MASIKQLLCGNCENPIEEHFNYCPHCGESIATDLICSACNGSGWYDSVDKDGNNIKCGACNGKGYAD